MLTLRDTERGIKLIKDYFETELGKKLNLMRVSSPLFVDPRTGLNDNLNGVERPVAFDTGEHGAHLEVVHSLAKWKRMALYRYGFTSGEGLYTDMNAIRRDEELDALHSIYVDQWDWEKVILREDRTEDFLKATVRGLFEVFKSTEYFVQRHFPELKPTLPDEITFITSQELEDLYPSFTPKEREHAIAREKKAVFIMKIGDLLDSGKKHDGRAPDYDDWALNGDIIFYHEKLDIAFELSSMGVRVDEVSLKSQLEKTDDLDRLKMDYHQKVLTSELPLTIGGGIGQSRICMFFLQRTHIGEVQASFWPEEMREELIKDGIQLL